MIRKERKMLTGLEVAKIYEAVKGDRRVWNSEAVEGRINCYSK